MKKFLLLSLTIPVWVTAMDYKKELLESGTIVAATALSTYAFGQGAEWVSNAIAPDYTNMYNRTQDTPLQRRNAIVNKWGILASLWAGVPLALITRVGPHPLSAQDLIKPVAITYGATAGFAALAGLYKYLRTQKSEKAKANAMMGTRFASYLVAPFGLVSWVLYKRIKG